MSLAFNPLMNTGDYSAASNNMMLVHWPLMDGLLHWYSEERPGQAADTSHRIAV